MKELVKKLATIQHNLKAPKGQYNNFGKYKYRSAEDILEAVKPHLAEQGCVLTLCDEVIMVGERFYVKAVATITDGENTISTTGEAREVETKSGMDGSQITGTASSYARKYALNGLFCIDDTKDADTDEYTKQTQQKQPAQQPQQKQAKVEQAFQMPSEAELMAAMAKIAAASSKAELKAIYDANPLLQKDAQFMGALTNKKNSLKK